MNVIILSILGALAIVVPLVILDAKQKGKLRELKLGAGPFAAIAAIPVLTWAVIHFSGADSCGVHLVLGTLYTVACK